MWFFSFCDILITLKTKYALNLTSSKSLLFAQAFPSISNVTVEVADVSDTNATQYSGLNILASTSQVDSTGTFTVNGTVQNTGDETAENVWVITTFYSTSGTVVGLNYTNYLDYLSGSLAPGDSVPFTATPTDNTVQLSSEITSYSLLIQSEPLTISASPTPSPSPSATPTSSPTVSPSAQSSGSSGFILAIVGAVVIVAVAATALAFLRKRRNLPPPPPPPPPGSQEEY
ncbi:MAG: FxLYD domain-containing protein [Candidatus Bathyarchaeia archaeon]